MMETVTLQGPVVVLPSEVYQNLVSRIAQLESAVAQLARLLEDLSDIRAMREAEAEYQAGDGAGFEDLLAEIEVDLASGVPD